MQHFIQYSHVFRVAYEREAVAKNHQKADSFCGTVPVWKYIAIITLGENISMFNSVATGWSTLWVVYTKVMEEVTYIQLHSFQHLYYHWD